MNRKVIPLLKVGMPSNIGNVLSEVLLSGHIAEGHKVREFENILGKYLNNNNVIATNSGTSAIHLALQLIGVGEGDEVITTPMTCQSTNQPILKTGAKIVWADIDKKTGNIDHNDIKRKITDKTKAILMMHWAGQPCDIDEIKKIAGDKIKVIEDAASAFGAEYKNEMIGKHTDYVCFSFQAVKHITTGDGGLLCVKKKSDKERAVLLRNNGTDKNAYRSETEWKFDIHEPGWNFHMNDISATIGIEQLKYHKAWLEKRRNNAQYFMKNISNVDGLELLEQKPDRKSANWVFTLLVNDKALFVDMMRSRGIQTSIVHQRNDINAIYNESKCELPNLDYFFKRMINIPVGWWLSNEDLIYIVDSIKKGW